MPDPTTGETPTTPAAATAAVTTPTPQNETPAAAKADDVQSLPEWAQRLIKDLNKENAGRRKAADEAAAKVKADDEAKLAESQQWQKLAEQRKQELDALTAVSDRYTALSTEITTALEAEIAAWPEEIKTLRPADADAATLLIWVKGARPLAAKLAAPTTPAPGQSPAPKPAGNGLVADAARQKAALQQVRTKF